MTYDIQIDARARHLVDITGFDLPEGQVTFLFGESGIGKSLMSKAIYGLLDPQELAVRINGGEYARYLASDAVRAIRQNGFFVFQEPSTHLNPLLTLEAQLHEGSLASGGEQEIFEQLWQGAPPAEVQELLSVYPKPHRPSGGEKQRMLLAMAFKKIDLVLAGKRDRASALFVFDEPTGSLDNRYRNLFLALLFERFRRTHFTVLLITHDYSMVSEVTRRYKDLFPWISFREIVAEAGRLHARPFLPETYLQWLQDQEPITGEPRRNEAAGHLLMAASGAEVFGRSLVLSRDPEGREACPLVVERGTMAYIKAPSGTGKTSLMKVLMGLQPARHLEMKIGSLELSSATPRRVWQEQVWGRRLTMVFQHADEALNPEATVGETFLGLPTAPPVTANRLWEILGELFDRGTDERFLEAKIKTLSGGQKQRVNLLRGLALDTDVLIADEPLNGLDFESTTKVISLLKSRQQEGKGIILISHNEEVLDPQVRREDVYYLHARRLSA